MLVISSLAAAAALYGAVVLLSLGPPSPVVLEQGSVRPTPVVPLIVHDHVAPRPAQRGPQPSPGPAHHHRLRVARPITPVVTQITHVARPTPHNDPAPPIAPRPPATRELQAVELPALPVVELPAALPLSDLPDRVS
jgi:hypothetical protein